MSSLPSRITGIVNLNVPPLKALTGVLLPLLLCSIMPPSLAMHKHSNQADTDLRILMVLRLTAGSYSHLNFHKKVAENLVRLAQVKQILILGLTEEHTDNGEIAHENPKITIWKRYRCGTLDPRQCSKHYPQMSKKENVTGGLWKKRPEFISKKEWGPKNTYIEFMLYNAKLLADLHALQFNVGSIEITTEMDALPLNIFRLLPTIKRTMVTSAPPPTITHWTELGFESFADFFPGVSLGEVDDHIKILKGESFRALNEKWLIGKNDVAQLTLDKMKHELSTKRGTIVNGLDLSQVANTLQSMSTQFHAVSIFLLNTQLQFEFPIVEKRVSEAQANGALRQPIAFISGIGLAEQGQQQLGQDTKHLFEHHESLILVSFGSVVDLGVPKENPEANDIAKEMAAKFLAVFDQFPNVQFIWKYGTDKDNYQQLGKHKNVHAKAWLEQQAIFGQNNAYGNRKLRAFISHCGNNSVMESVNDGIPLICIPLFADQPESAEAMVIRGQGLSINIHKTDWPKVLKKSIERMLVEPAFQKNMHNAMEQFKKIKPAEELLKQFTSAFHLDVAEHVSHRRNQRATASESGSATANNSNPLRLQILLGIKRFDGGRIKIHAPMDGVESNVYIEKLLDKEYGIKAEYLNYDVQAYQKVWNGLIYTTHLRFLKPHLHWEQDESYSIWDVLTELAKHDSRWIMPGNEVKPACPTAQFMPRFDGHTMVVLTKKKLTIAQNAPVQLRTQLAAWPMLMQEISEFQRANRTNMRIQNPFYDALKQMNAMNPRSRL